MRRLLVLIAALALPLPAAAQSVMFEGLQTDLMRLPILLAPVAGVAAQSPARGAPAAKPAPRPAPIPAAAVTTYQASPEVSARVRRQFVAWFRGISPAEALQLEAVLARTDPVAEWSRTVRPDGLRAGTPPTPWPPTGC